VATFADVGCKQFTNINWEKKAVCLGLDLEPKFLVKSKEWWIKRC
jgi:hypothetical protein